MKRVLVSLFLLLASVPLLAANIAPTGTITSPSGKAAVMAAFLLAALTPKAGADELF